MKNKIVESLQDITDELACGIRCLCGKPSPMKRLVMVLVIGGALQIAFIYRVVDSIYRIAKNDAKKEFIKMEPIRQLNLQNDSILSEGNNEPEVFHQWEKLRINK